MKIAPDKMVTVPAKLLTDAKDAIEELLEFIAMAEFSYSTGRKIPARERTATLDALWLDLEKNLA